MKESRRGEEGERGVDGDKVIALHSSGRHLLISRIPHTMFYALYRIILVLIMQWTPRVKVD